MNTRPAATLSSVLFLLTVVAAEPAAAQVPFFGRGATIFDPEIGVVQSGVVLDAQATVSADRKYVTLTMRSTQAQLLSLQEFAFQRGNAAAAAAGFVGGAGMAPAADGAWGGRGSAGAREGERSEGHRSERDRRTSVLDRPGMTLLGRVTHVRVRPH